LAPPSFFFSPSLLLIIIRFFFFFFPRAAVQSANPLFSSRDALGSKFFSKLFGGYLPPALPLFFLPFFLEPIISLLPPFSRAKEALFPFPFSFFLVRYPIFFPSGHRCKRAISFPFFLHPPPLLVGEHRHRSPSSSPPLHRHRHAFFFFEKQHFFLSAAPFLLPFSLARSCPSSIPLPPPREPRWQFGFSLLCLSFSSWRQKSASRRFAFPYLSFCSKCKTRFPSLLRSYCTARSPSFSSIIIRPSPVRYFYLPPFPHLPADDRQLIFPSSPLPTFW